MKPVKVDCCKNCEKHYTSQCDDFKYNHKHTPDDDWCKGFKDKDNKDGRKAAA